ncbi:MAG: M56 family metallopeptidase [Firmicutes bacterium]|nr:M56 family metallopeptidase [Bacillota bacterium]
MSSEFVLKGIFAGIFSVAFAWIVFSRNEREMGSENEGQRYLPMVSGAILPTFLLTIIVMELMIDGTALAARAMLSMGASIFLHISVYYAALLLVMPLLRKCINARACAMLWLIPNYLYLTEMNYMEVSKPLVVIRTPGNAIWIAMGIWMMGFIVVFFGHIVAHLRFRKGVLQDAAEVTDPEILSIWEEEIQAARFKRSTFPLVTSPAVATPLAVGLFRWSMKVVLPRHSYDPEELRLIFRHEIVHIGREDHWAKFFLLFCTAMCWFNPLMWVAMDRSADDLELSCDETVLLGADDHTRRQYAELLLTTAGDERGFTTCLAANASSLRYRLRSVVGTGKRRSGAILVGVIFFALCMTCGYVSFAYGGRTGEELLFQGQDHQQFQLRSITDYTAPEEAFDTKVICRDEAAFCDYLAGLELDEMTGNYAFTETKKEFACLFDTPQGMVNVALKDEYMAILPFWGGSLTKKTYYVAGGLDWDYLNTIITVCPAVKVKLTDGSGSYGHAITSTLVRLTALRPEGEELLFAWDGEGEANGIFGYDAREASLTFNCQPVGSITIEAEDWDRTTKTVLTPREREGELIVDTLPGPAHYRICGEFVGKDGERYAAEFRFEIGEV